MKPLLDRLAVAHQRLYELLSAMHEVAPADVRDLSDNFQAAHMAFERELELELNDIGQRIAALKEGDE